MLYYPTATTPAFCDKDQGPKFFRGNRGKMILFRNLQTEATVSCDFHMTLKDKRKNRTQTKNAKHLIGLSNKVSFT